VLGAAGAGGREIDAEIEGALDDAPGLIEEEAQNCELDESEIEA
jgi:hypothetical protein